MFRITILTYSVAVCMLYLIFDQAFAICSKARYDRLAELDGLSCLPSDVVLETMSTSIASCLGMCYGKRCATVFYNPDTGSCTGCYTWCTDNSGLPTSEGSTAYKFHFDCESDEVRYKTSCYKPTPALAWTGAQTYCRSTAYRDLFVPETLDELEYVTSWMINSDPQLIVRIIGYTDTEVEGTWLTVHGKPLEHENWNSVEPNGHVGENCAVVYGETSEWADYPCSVAVGSICEKDMLAL